MRKHDYKVYWLEQYLKYISASIMCYYCILTEKRKRGRLREKEKDRKPPSVSNIERNFSAGGRHQTTIDGEIVCEYLQTCTDIKLLNNSEHFKGKCFHFEGYKLLSDTSNDLLKSSAPLYFSRIPLEILTNYLNMKELQLMSDIPMPNRLEKKNNVGLFS